MVYPQLSSGPQVFMVARQFHSFHVCLSGVIHKKVAQITKVKFKKQQLPPEMYILRTMKRKIQRVGSTDSNTWHRWCWCMLLSKETDVSRLSTYYLHSLEAPSPNILGENCFWQDVITNHQ